MYTQYNFPTRKELEAEVAKGELVGVFQPEPLGPEVPNGLGVVVGPHGDHKWYATVMVEDGRITQVIG